MPRGRKTAAAALRWSAGNEGRGARRAGAAPVGKSGPVRRQVGGAGAGRGGGCPRRSAHPSPRAHARTAKQGPCGAQPVAYIRLEVCHTALARIELNLGADHVPPTRPLPVRGHCRHDRLHLRRLGEAYGIMAVQRLRELLAPLLLVVCRCCPSGCVCHPALASRSDLVGAYVRAPARGGLWRGRECRRAQGARTGTPDDNSITPSQLRGSVHARMHRHCSPKPASERKHSAWQPAAEGFRPLGPGMPAVVPTGP